MGRFKERLERHRERIQEHKKRIKERLEKHKDKFPYRFAREFKHFLNEYKIIGLAIAFVIGAAANQLIKSLVENIIMPLISPLIPSGEWKEAIWNIGPFAFSWGKFLSDFIYFSIVALVVFLIARKLLKSEKEHKK